MPSSRNDTTEGVKKPPDKLLLSPFYEPNSIPLFDSLWNVPLNMPIVNAPNRSGFLKGFHPNSKVQSSFCVDERIPRTSHARILEYQERLPIIKDAVKQELIRIQTVKPKFGKKPKRKPLMACRKIRIFPSAMYTEFFRKCFGVERRLYNDTIAGIENMRAERKALLRSLAQEIGCVHDVKIRVKIKPSNTIKSGSKTQKTSQKTKAKTKKTEVLIGQCCQPIVEDSKYFCEEHKEKRPMFGVPYDFTYWRNRIMIKNEDLPKDLLWLSEVPYDVRQLAIKDAVTSYDSALKSYRKGYIKKFKIHFRTKKETDKGNAQYFHVDHRTFKEGGILYPGFLGTREPLIMHPREKKWLENYFKIFSPWRQKKKAIGTKRKKQVQKEDYMRKDVIISREYPGMYYLQVPYVRHVMDTATDHRIKPGQINGRTTARKVVAIDPGVAKATSLRKASFSGVAARSYERIISNTH